MFNYCQVCKEVKGEHGTVMTRTVMSIGHSRKLRKAAKKLYKKLVFEVCPKCLHTKAGNVKELARIEEQEKSLEESRKRLERFIMEAK